MLKRWNFLKTGFYERINHPLNAELVEDALSKAFGAGIRYCFTWNVRQFVLFDSHMQGVPFAQRNIEGPANVVEASVSDDVHREWARDAIRGFWAHFLERFADLVLERRAFEPSPIDQRFVSWLEGALEDPIAHTEDTLAGLTRADHDFNLRLSAWMLRQGWEPSDQTEQLKRNLERASRLSCYILVTRLVFYQVLRRRFRQMSPLTVEGVDTSEQLREVLEARFGEAVRYSHDYETIFEPDEGDLGYTIPFLPPQAPRDWSRLIQRIEEFDFSSLDFDVIGQMYERLIGAEERRRFGQFYTSPDVVDLINAFCIRKPGDRVLDPACGGGTFLVRAYARKRALAQTAGRPPTSHGRILDEIFGIDIAAFPAQLSTINLAVRHLSDEPNYPLVARAQLLRRPAGQSPVQQAALGRPGAEDSVGGSGRRRWQPALHPAGKHRERRQVQLRRAVPEGVAGADEAFRAVGHIRVLLHPRRQPAQPRRILGLRYQHRLAGH